MRLLCALLAAWFAYVTLAPIVGLTRIEYRQAPAATAGRQTC
ncbi:hypothetical protein [Streptomyces noursei]|nr:hypothetical protein [Streptomyces noursei]MCZ1014015.1 hypothetical protein [Streptomyces noursei]